MAAKPGAYFQREHNAYRYFDGEAWVGERYKTKEETVQQYTLAKKKEEEARKAKEAAEKKAAEAAKPKKQHFVKPPKPWAWAVAACALLLTAFLTFWSIDSNNRQAPTGSVDPNGSSWVDSTPKPSQSPSESSSN